jgi:hypothetical protein
MHSAITLPRPISFAAAASPQRASAPAASGVETAVVWPGDKRFAFTIFDDPDAQTLEQSRMVYDFLSDLGIFTTKAVWPLSPVRAANSDGETCGNPAYLKHVLELQRRGFEIGFHNAAPHDSTRDETRRSLLNFRDWFGDFPSAMANHYNAEALYWGSARLSGTLRSLYETAQRFNPKKASARFRGHVPDDEYFWGDLARNWIRYCRNFVYRDVNTLRACPHTPYHDADRPFVNRWFSSSDGHDCSAFLGTLSERNQDRLEREGGACIMYAHFGHGFVENGKLNPAFRSLMARLSRKSGWFVPVSTVLAHLETQNRGRLLSRSERSRIERSWLLRKAFTGTS